MKSSFVVAALCGVAVAAALGFARPASAVEAESSYLPNAGTNTQGDQMLSPWTPGFQDNALTQTAPARTFSVPQPGYAQPDNSDGAVRIIPQRTVPSGQEVLVVPETGVLVVPYSDVR